MCRSPRTNSAAGAAAGRQQGCNDDRPGERAIHRHDFYRAGPGRLVQSTTARVDTPLDRPSNRSGHPTSPSVGASLASSRPKEESDANRPLSRCSAAAAPLLACGSAVAQQPITLHGAVQFNDDHAFTKALVRFEELVKKYYGKPINFVLHKNSELGLEKDYFAFMNQGISVDYGIVSPGAHVDVLEGGAVHRRPFLFRDLDHWNKVLDADTLKPIADEVAAKGDVMLIGFAGGGTRNIFANKPVRNLAEMKGLKVRVQGAPIWSKTFAASACRRR
jgi:hypothetical protein